MPHALLMVFALTLSGTSDDGTTLDDFREGITDSGQVAASPWRTTGEKSLLGTELHDGQRVLTLTVPFATHPDWSRVNMDRNLKLDLSRAKRFVLEVEAERQDLKPFGVITLYFRSPGGWYGGSLGFGRYGRQKLVCDKDTFYTEGSPAGWDQIEGIRIAFWQGQAKDGRLILHRLSVPKRAVSARELAEQRLEALDAIGHDGPAETEAWIRDRAVPDAVAELQKSQKRAADAAEILKRVAGGQDASVLETASTLDAAELQRATCLVEEAYKSRENAYLFSQQKPSPGRRRGFWNHSGAGAYPGDWDRTMREMSAAGFNAIFTNLSWGGCAHYPSEVLPQSKTYEKWGDQLAQAVAAGKKHGVEVHVWKVNYNLSGRTPRAFVEKLRRARRLGRSVKGEQLEWLCPSHPKNFRLERDAMLEVVQKYDVDGVHFDYIRYKSKRYCYCDGCRQRFEAASGKKVERWPHDCYSGPREKEYNDWRCGTITRLVKAVHEGVQRINPKVRVSAAVFQSYPTCRKEVAQDWLLWAKQGYVDFLCPMDYQPNKLSFENIVAHQRELLDGAVPLCPGIGASASGSRLDAQQVATQIFLTERLGTAGFVIFNLSPREAESLLPRFKEMREVQER